MQRLHLYNDTVREHIDELDVDDANNHDYITTAEHNHILLTRDEYDDLVRRATAHDRTTADIDAAWDRLRALVLADTTADDPTRDVAPPADPDTPDHG